MASHVCPLCLANNTIQFQKCTDQREYFICEVCDLVFLLEEYFVDPLTERQEYDLHENSPDSQGYRQWLSKLVDPLSSFVLQQFSERKDIYGLDYGCGPGPTISVMMNEKGLNSYQNYDVFFFPQKHNFQPSHFDVISCTEVLEHLHSPHEVLSEMDALLKPGGFIGFMTCLRDSSCSFEKWWYRRDCTHVCFFSLKTVEFLSSRFCWELSFHKSNCFIFKKKQ
eukprot:GCRY01002901.1.p1 GENE.GCRY01002901.1~~GCRY01002901.1.p1  ORF type:complete len:224 (+),score=14.40 GCRY01002901.1:134-805(+)